MYKKLIIKEIREEVKGFKTFTFTEESSAEIDYQAGQYLTLLHPRFPEEVRRSYSIISAPVLNEPLTIGVKRIDNGIFSRHLIDNAKPGDELLTIGAAGFFVLPHNMQDYEQLFFLAAGSGITPIFSLIKTVLNIYPKVPVVLIYSNASKEKTIFKTELETLATSFPDNFKFEFIYSNSPDLSRAHLHRELLVYFLQKFMVSSPEKTLAFTCGPKEYMRMCMYGFRFVNIPAENIRKEIFNIEKAVPKIEPPDSDQHLVTILQVEAKKEIPVQFPVSILQAARKHGISLPYSCETGKCGNCVAKVLKGKIWMAYNEVLTERDLQQGLILTCVGFPVHGNAEIRIGK